jgi:hypothetical protein
MPEDKQLVLCKDCKHSFRTFAKFMTFGFGKYSLDCRKNYVEEHDEDDLVLGKVKRKGRYESCSLTRIQSKNCGEEGKWWEPKDSKKHFFTVIKHEATLGKE